MKCRLCGYKEVGILIDFGKQPIVHHFIKNKDDKFPKFSFRLGQCKHCNFFTINGLYLS